MAYGLKTTFSSVRMLLLPMTSFRVLSLGPQAFLKRPSRKVPPLGGGAVILPGVTIGEKAMVGAGAVVTRSVQSGTIVVGNPARMVGLVDQWDELNAVTIGPQGETNNRKDARVP